MDRHDRIGLVEAVDDLAGIVRIVRRFIEVSAQADTREQAVSHAVKQDLSGNGKL